MEHSRNLTFLTILEISYSGLFANCYVMADLRIFTSSAGLRFSHYALLMKFHIMEHLRICTFWTFQEFLHF